MLKFNLDSDANCNDHFSVKDHKWENEYHFFVEHNEETIKNWLISTGVSTKKLNNYTILNRPDAEKIYDLDKFDMMSWAVPKWYPNAEDENHMFTMERVYFINISELSKAINFYFDNELFDNELET
jgi:hypothetical protein